MSVRRTVMAGAALVVTLALTLMGAAPASAAVVTGGGKPSDRVFVPSGLPITFPGGTGQACAFDVTISEVANNEYARTFPNGNTLITGRLVLRVTNDVTGQSVVRDASGPVLITTGTNGEQISVLSGASLSPVFAGHDDTGSNLQGLFIFHGPTVFTDGQLTKVSGSYEDLCLTLA